MNGSFLILGSFERSLRGVSSPGSTLFRVQQTMAIQEPVRDSYCYCKWTFLVLYGYHTNSHTRVLIVDTSPRISHSPHPLSLLCRPFSCGNVASLARTASHAPGRRTLRRSPASAELGRGSGFRRRPVVAAAGCRGRRRRGRSRPPIRPIGEGHGGQRVQESLPQCKRQIVYIARP